MSLCVCPWLERMGWSWAVSAASGSGQCLCEGRACADHLPTHAHTAGTHRLQQLLSASRHARALALAQSLQSAAAELEDAGPAHMAAEAKALLAPASPPAGAAPAAAAVEAVVAPVSVEKGLWEEDGAACLEALGQWSGLGLQVRPHAHGVLRLYM